MKKKKKAIIFLSLFSIFSLILSSFFALSASAAPTPPDTDNCAAVCLYDKTHGKTVVMENGDKLLNTSTSAKVMLGLLACEILADRLDDTVVLNERMLSGSSGYSMGLKSGEKIKTIDLLYGAVCGSYNDAAYAVASLCAENSASFVDMMNEKAAALGASSTCYTNPLGYPDNDAMVSTLSDTLKIAIAASENELYMQICSAKSYTVSATNFNSERTIYNRNRLLYTPSNADFAYFNPACLGMNAGNSGDAGGWSVITLAQDDGADYICIILGGRESDKGEIFAYKAANTLIDWACETYNTFNLFKPGDVLGKVSVSMTSLGDEEVDFIAADALDVYIPNGSWDEIEVRVEYVSNKIEAPIKKGDKIGVATAYQNGEMIGSCDLLLSKDCEANLFMKTVDAIGRYTKSRAFIASAAFVAVVLPIAIIISKRRRWR